MTYRLNPERLRAYIEQVELPSRLGRWPEPEARRIIQFGSFVGSQIEQHEAMERTMEYGRAHISKFEERGHSVANGTIFRATRLSGSKGRFTRGWHAPEGGLWGSMIYISTLLPAYRLLVPLALGVACCEAVRASGVETATIRWVNDVMIAGLKVAGFLSEQFTGRSSKEDYCLLGFGINVNNREFPRALIPIATSVAAQVGAGVDLERFSCCFLAKLSWNLGLLYHWEQQELERFSETDEEHPLISRWRELSDTLSRRVVFGFDVLTRPQYRATVLDITNDGGLRLRLEDGSEVVEYSGEIRYLD